MCVQYWPAGKNREEVYSGVGVTVENEEQLANFVIRTIRLRKVRRHLLRDPPKKCTPNCRICKNKCVENVNNPV